MNTEPKSSTRKQINIQQHMKKVCMGVRPAKLWSSNSKHPFLHKSIEKQVGTFRTSFVRHLGNGQSFTANK